jgi:hypothetical protein
MKTTFGARWQNGPARERRARVAVETNALVLTPNDEECAPREVLFDELVAVEIRPSADPAGKYATIVLKLRAGDFIELESNVDRWIVANLLGQLLAHGLGATQRILVSARLKPGSRERVRELLRAGPPFTPDETRFALHEVYLLDDEALLLFATQPGVTAGTIDEPDLWAATAAWHDLITGEVRIGESVYSWSREQPTAVAHFGLGY